jgi:UDP-N-acetylglucosamine 2-epimerase (non-hydrolysing)
MHLKRNNALPLKVFTLFGTRPEVIKLAPVLRAFSTRPEEFTSISISSGQHTDLLAPFIKLFDVDLDHDLQTMRSGQPLNILLSRILQGLDPLLESEKPDLILVQGDTTTALAGALAGFYRKIPVGHVEAGLRTDDAHSPFPEEMNRRLITRMATLHFPATPRNRNVLLDEGVSAESIFLTGNPVVDALQYMSEHVAPSPRMQELLKHTEGYRRIILTTHRRESFGDILEGNLRILREFIEDNEDLVLIFPVHPNPVVRKAADDILKDAKRVHLIEPLDYADFIALLSHSWLITSDSGGIQEEAPSLGKPVIVLRENTERPEAVEAGVAVLAGTPELLAQALAEAYVNKSTPTRQTNPFGDGTAAHQILNSIRYVFRNAPEPLGVR